MTPLWLLKEYQPFILKTFQMSITHCYYDIIFIIDSWADEPNCPLFIKGGSITRSWQTELLAKDGLGFKSQLCHQLAYETWL